MGVWVPRTCDVPLMIEYSVQYSGGEAFGGQLGGHASHRTLQRV